VRTPETCPMVEARNEALVQCRQIRIGVGSKGSVPLTTCAACCEHQSPKNPITAAIVALGLESRLIIGDATDRFVGERLPIENAARRLGRMAGRDRVRRGLGRGVFQNRLTRARAESILQVTDQDLQTLDGRGDGS